MLTKILNKISTLRAAAKLRAQPGVQEAMLCIDLCWRKNEDSKCFSPEFAREITEQMWQECLEILAAPDPRMANRQKLCEMTLMTARYFVLTVDDHDEIIGHLGVTGALHSEIVALFKIDDSLKQEVDSSPESYLNSYEFLFNYVHDKGRIMSAYMHLFKAFRLFFKEPVIGTPLPLISV